MRDGHGKYGNERKYGNKGKPVNEGKYGNEGKYMGGKGRGMWRTMLKEGPEAGMLNRILGGEVRDKTGSTGNRRKCRRKRKYGNME